MWPIFRLALRSLAQLIIYKNIHFSSGYFLDFGLLPILKENRDKSPTWIILFSFYDQLILKNVPTIWGARLKTFAVKIQETAIVSNVFIAKEECENAGSDLVKNLFKRAKYELLTSCYKAIGVKECDQKKFLSQFRGEIEFLPGRGYTQKISCEISASLN